ncbi:MAG: hypothetical protein WCY53_03965 [Sphaerochaetaceae bacterium]
MRNSIKIVFVLILLTPFLFANQAVYEKADSLYWTDKYEEAVSYLKGELSNTTDNKVKAEILWRLGRATLAIGDELKDEGASNETLFATFEEGQAFAEQSIESFPLAMGHVYRASNIGRWGETKGPLNSLSKAKPMRDDFTVVIDQMRVTDNTISWYVLGQLYYKLPGWPISFGDLNTAISYTRKAIDTIPSENLYHGHFKALAEMLYKRDYNAKKRSTFIATQEKEWNKSKQSILDQHAYYEGAKGSSAIPFYSPVALDKMSDRQEAVMLLKYAQAKYNIWPFHSRADIRTFDAIGDMLKQWGF